MTARWSSILALIVLGGCVDGLDEGERETLLASGAPAGATLAGTPMIEAALPPGKVGVVGYPRRGRDLQLFVLPRLAFPTALCNDGTSPILYFRPGVGIGTDHWLIELEGGGGCRTAQECADRYWANGTNFGRQLMGSQDYRTNVPNMAATGIQSIDPASSPYGNYNHVFVHYCSSDGWAGNSTATVGTALVPPAHASEVTFSTRFNGNAILDAVLRALRRDGAILPAFTLAGSASVMPDLDDASGNVVIAGGSAGGIGVELQLDRIVATLTASHNPARSLPFYTGMIDSAFPPSFERLGFQLTGVCGSVPCDWKGYVEATASYYPMLSDESCTTMHSAPTDAFRCVDASHVVRNHITTPMFIRQGETDSLLSRLYVDAQFAISPSATAAMTTDDFEDRVRAQAEQIPVWNLTAEERPTKIPGAFVPDCIDHDPLRDDAAFFQTTIGTWTWATTWASWRASSAPVVNVNVTEPAIPSTFSTCY